MTLTDPLIRNARPKDRPYKLSRELGLFVLVKPNGTKLWRYSYTYRGKEKLISFGAYPAVGLALARKRDQAQELATKPRNYWHWISARVNVVAATMR